MELTVLGLQLLDLGVRVDGLGGHVGVFGLAYPVAQRLLADARLLGVPADRAGASGRITAGIDGQPRRTVTKFRGGYFEVAMISQGILPEMLGSPSIGPGTLQTHTTLHSAKEYPGVRRTTLLRLST